MNTAVRSENELLRRELEAWQEEARRRDHIIMNMTEAMKALSPPSGRIHLSGDARRPPRGRGGQCGPPDHRGAQNGTERPSWWRRSLFGADYWRKRSKGLRV